MKQKKLFSGLLALLMIVSLAACGGKDAPAPSSSTPETSAPAASDPPSSQPESNAPAVEIPTAPDIEGLDMAALDAEIKELAAKVKTVTDGKLTIGTSADFAPYEFHIMENGVDKIVGFDVALGQAIADELGVAFEVKDISFDSILMELNSGTIDLGLAGFSPTPERLEAVDMSLLYYTGGQSLMIKKSDEGKITGFADLGAGTSVGAQTGSIQADLAKEHTPEANLVALQTVPSIIMDLKTGKIDAAYIETVVAEGYLATQDDIMILCEVPFDSEGSSAAVKKGNEDLLNFVNAVITKVVANGTMAQLVEDANALSSQSIS